jgi:hypothetical protein
MYDVKVLRTFRPKSQVFKDTSIVLFIKPIVSAPSRSNFKHQLKLNKREE